MRFMMFMLPNVADDHYMPTAEAVAEMTKYNEALKKSGALLSAEGLHPQSKSVRVKYSKGKPTVVDGPFTEAKEAIGGFALVEVRSKEEAIELG